MRRAILMPVCGTRQVAESHLRSSGNRCEECPLPSQRATWKAAEPEGATTQVRVVRLFHLIPAVKWFLAIAVLYMRMLCAGYGRQSAPLRFEGC